MKTCRSLDWDGQTNKHSQQLFEDHHGIPDTDFPPKSANSMRYYQGVAKLGPLSALIQYYSSQNSIDFIFKTMPAMLFGLRPFFWIPILTEVSRGKSPMNGPFSIAMFDYRREGSSIFIAISYVEFEDSHDSKRRHSKAPVMASSSSRFESNSKTQKCEAWPFQLSKLEVPTISP